VIRVLIVDDNDDVRAILATLLLEDGRFDVCGSVANADQGLQAAVTTEPDAIVLDHHMPGRSGAEVLPALRQHCPRARIVLWTSTPADARAVAAPVVCLDKGAPTDELFRLLAGDPPQLIRLAAVTQRASAGPGPRR
jgi:DNA-binding NarL/FixJ family response regulator